MALGFQDCCNSNSYFYLSDNPTFVSQNEVYFIMTDDGNTFCAKYVNVPSLNYLPPTYSVLEMTQFTSCSTCLDDNACPTTNPINLIGDGAVIAVNDCTIKTQFPLEVSCYTVNPTIPNPNGGIVGLTFNGGVPPYKLYKNVGGNYIQNSTSSTPQTNSPIYSNVVGGEYLMKLIDGNQQEVFLACTISTPAQLLTATFNKINVNFYGDSNGSVTFTLGGGTPPYFVTYDSVTTPVTDNLYTLSNLSLGNYSFVFSDSGIGSNNQDTNPINVQITQPAELNWPNTLCMNVTKCGVTLQLAFLKTQSYTNLRPTYSLSTNSKYLLGLASSTPFILYYDDDVNKWVTTQINEFDSPYNTGYSLFPIECEVGQQSWKYETNVVSNPLTNLPQNNTWNITPGSYLINPTITISTICVPTISQALSSPTCQGTSQGVIQIIATGIAPFTFTLAGGGQNQSSTTNFFYQLAAGSYVVSVTDGQGNTSATQTVQVTSIPTLTVDITNNCASIPTISEL